MKLNHFYPRAVVFGTFIVALVVGSFTVMLIERNRRLEQRRVLLEIASSQAYNLQRQLDRSLSSTFALASVLRQGDQTIEGFDSLAADMIESYGGISSLQLAPGGVVQQIYPLEGNEGAIGHDLLKDPLRRTEALAAIESQSLTLAGPFELIQGGVAVIGRYPVFITDKETGEQVFWGFTVALIRMAKLLTDSNLYALTDSGYAFQISRLDPDTGIENVFAQSSEDLLVQPVTYDLTVPNGRWTLSITPQGGWQTPPAVFIEALLILLIAILLTSRVNALIRQPQRLRLLVEERTHNLKEVNEQMQREVDEHRQTTNALVKAKEEAEEASRAKDDFLSRMSHELRTPLNAILGFAQLLELDIDAEDTEQQESVQLILKGGRHLLQLVDEVLDISRITSGELSLSLEAVSVAEATTEARRLIDTLAKEHRIHIQHHTHGTEDLYVLADAKRIRQVLLNLLSNAVKYNRVSGNVNISYSATPKTVRLAITDTGPGIPEKHIERLFTAFDRLGADQSLIEGSGIGLALSKHLVDAMGGTIGVESEIGKGSTFWVELKRVSDNVVRNQMTPGASTNPTGQMKVETTTKQTYSFRSLMKVHS